jgi:transcription elongation GreA/GreB family factor
MSKAFTREDSALPDSPIRRLGVPVPELNVVTPEGLRHAREELEELTHNGGDPDRIRELSEHLSTATPVEPEDLEVVGVGATVVVEDEEGDPHTYRIVGAIEADAKRGWISWMTPLAQALWGARVGDTVTLPRGEAEVVEIHYAGA